MEILKLSRKKNYSLCCPPTPAHALPGNGLAFWLKKKKISFCFFFSLLALWKQQEQYIHYYTGVNILLKNIMPELKPLELQSSALQTLICGQVCLTLPETPSSLFILIVLLFFIYLSRVCSCGEGAHLQKSVLPCWLWDRTQVIRPWDLVASLLPAKLSRKSSDQFYLRLLSGKCARVSLTAIVQF